MKNKTLHRIIAIILAIVMVVSVLWAAIGSLSANAVTQSQIDKLRDEAKRLSDQKRSVQSEINSLQYEQLSASAKKTVLDGRISLTEMEIDNINELIEMYRLLIVEKEAEVKAAQKREDNQLELYKKRVRDMEENGAISYIAVIFDAASFSDLLARIDFVGDIMRSDEAVYKNLVKARLDTIAAKDALVVTVSEQEAERASLQEKQAELEVQVNESIELLKLLQEDIDVRVALRDEMDAEAEKLQADIKAKTEELRRQEEAEAASGRSSGTVIGTGSLRWPAPSNVVTRTFGTMEHPLYKDIRPHYGIDLRAAYGSDIYAADTGKVITATYSSSYGNYIVISHGGGRTTLYAHMSKLKSKVGDTVTKGAVIGYAGSTGASTATHLHFEVSENGERKNPLNYFSGGYVIKDGA
ncbi:MAG: peptidoglycan DD-metalloendopeptidase family protein [Oscillospiraceae bacterium]|jgi:murein DD-endopeptidase MepM/ murein hydrolase activator NlpD|nr:peptidoglycan DD-metalloendopeptidase family protein [Oscillospiraceae bacterium]